MLRFAELVMFGIAVGVLVWALQPFRKWLEARILSRALKQKKFEDQSVFETRNYKRKD